MKVGKYIRTPYGIRKIINITKDDGYGKTRVRVIELDKILDTFYKYGYTFYTDERVIKEAKHSFDLLDLIKPMDLMFIDIDNGYAGGIIVPRIAETQEKLNKYIEKFKSGELILKGIVTREQINNMIYEVI